MKTAEEYIPDSMPCADIWRKIIREVQLDAYRAGGLDAAEIAKKKNCYMCVSDDAILTHFNNPKLEIPK